MARPVDTRRGDEGAIIESALTWLAFERVRALDRVIHDYASGDVEATIALYEADNASAAGAVTGQS